MLFMNESEIDEALRRHRDHPVLRRATRLLSEFRHEVNRKSDGWHSWPGGARAARQLMELIQRRDGTEAELRKAIGPIRSVCTRKNLTFPEEALK
jgi:hypothetical protein